MYCTYLIELNLFVSQHLFEVEIVKLKCLFYDNNYPTWFFDKIYNKFEAKLDDIPVDEVSVVNNVELFCTTVLNVMSYFCSVCR